MQDIVLIGLNHNTAPVELRECIAIPEEGTRAALDRLADIPVIDEALLLSTCNRVEVLLVSKQPDQAAQETKRFLARLNDLPVERFVFQSSFSAKHVSQYQSSLLASITISPSSFTKAAWHRVAWSPHTLHRKGPE